MRRKNNCLNNKIMNKMTKCRKWMIQMNNSLLRKTHQLANVKACKDDFKYQPILMSILRQFHIHHKTTTHSIQQMTAILLKGRCQNNQRVLKAEVGRQGIIQSASYDGKVRMRKRHLLLLILQINKEGYISTRPNRQLIINRMVQILSKMGQGKIQLLCHMQI